MITSLRTSLPPIFLPVFTGSVYGQPAPAFCSLVVDRHFISSLRGSSGKGAGLHHAPELQGHLRGKNVQIVQESKLLLNICLHEARETRCMHLSGSHHTYTH